MKLGKIIVLFSGMIAITLYAWNYFVNGFMQNIIPPIIFDMIGWAAFFLLGLKIGDAMQEEDESQEEELPRVKLPQIIEDKVK